MHGHGLPLGERLAGQKARSVALRISGQMARVSAAARSDDNDVSKLGGGDTEKADLCEIGGVRRAGARRDADKAAAERLGGIERPRRTAGGDRFCAGTSLCER